MHLQCASGTNVGRKRSQNQDSFASLPELGLFVVADGMGGHKGGETASALAIEGITGYVRKVVAGGASWNPNAVMTEAIRTASRGIYEHAEKHIELQGMGTTTTALLFKSGLLTVGHVGDSRCYYFKPEGVWQATRDHSLVQEKLRAGLITRAQAKTDRMKNVITRSVGFESDVDVEIYEMVTQPGDLFLICSDGLSGMVEDRDILALVRKYAFDGKDLKSAADQLIEAANRNGGDDNVTVVIVSIGD